MKTCRGKIAMTLFIEHCSFPYSFSIYNWHEKNYVFFLERGKCSLRDQPKEKQSQQRQEELRAQRAKQAKQRKSISHLIHKDQDKGENNNNAAIK